MAWTQEGPGFLATRRGQLVGIAGILGEWEGLSVALISGWANLGRAGGATA